MVPKVAGKGRNFVGAGLYYLHDKKALTRERVAFTHTENLPTRDPDKAIKCMAWTALRSPVPGFGGRKPLKQDLAGYDEDAEDPQYNLVFHAWDAQFDEFSRTHYAFAPASDDAKKRYAAGLRHPDGLVATVPERKGKARSAWIAACQRRVQEWAGEGLRLN